MQPFNDEIVNRADHLSDLIRGSLYPNKRVLLLDLIVGLNLILSLPDSAKVNARRSEIIERLRSAKITDNAAAETYIQKVQADFDRWDLVEQDYLAFKKGKEAEVQKYFERVADAFLLE